MSELRTPDELSQAEYDEAADKEHAMRMHVWRLHCRVRELASLLEMRSLTPVTERLICESRALVDAGKIYE